MSRYVLLFAVFASMFCSPALAERINYSTSWVTGEPIAELDKPLPAIGEEAGIKHGDIAMAARLYPQEIAYLAAQIVDGDGDELAPAGSELYALRTNSGKAFCLTGSQKISAFASAMLGDSGAKQTCFVDGDGNGTFESFFTARSSVRGVPNFTGRTSKKPKLIVETRYETKPIENMQAIFFVALEYRGNTNLQGNHIFETIFGSGSTKENLTSRMVIKAGELPAQVNFLGGQFELLEGGGNSATIRVVKPVERRPFDVLRSVSYRFY